MMEPVSTDAFRALSSDIFGGHSNPGYMIGYIIGYIGYIIGYIAPSCRTFQSSELYKTARLSTAYIYQRAF